MHRKSIHAIYRASHNLAKYSLEFAIAIRRSQLRRGDNDRSTDTPLTHKSPQHGSIEPMDGGDHE